MNLRNVLRAYSLLRQLSDDESALLETLRQANDGERALLAEAMSDKPQKKPAKKSSSKSSGKSARASGMAAQLNAQLGGRRQEDVVIGNADAECSNCIYVFAHNVHHLPSVEGYHEFRPVAASEPAHAVSGGEEG